MEQYLQEYARWQKQELPEDLAAELALARKDEGELQDRFCRVMRFGTSGLRGKMGVGTNRINSIILSKATRAISRYLTERYESPAMVIGYDTRHNSREYADGIAQEFARSGIRCYLFAEPTPVPVVSFAIRQLGLNGGVMITASHNTKEYNGYKVYDHFGNQIDDRKAALIEQYMEAEPTFWEGVPKDLTEAQKEGTISFLEEDIKEAKDLLAAKGVTYRNFYFAKDSAAGKFTENIFAYPITYVIDSEGNIVGEPILGALMEDAQKELLDKYIQEALSK